MRRRQFLATTAGLAAVPGVVGGTQSSSDAPESSLEPLATVPVDGLKEAVVGEDGTTVYAAVTDGFATADVGDPWNPVVLAERRDLLADREGGPLTSIFDVSYDDGTLLVVGPANPRSGVNAALFYDVTDPANPDRVAVHETDYPIHNACFRDGLAYLTANGRHGNGLTIVDPNGGDPERRGSWSIASVDEAWDDVFSGVWSLHDVYVQGDTAYLAHWDAGTFVVDVADPANPALVTKVRGREAAAFADLEFRGATVEQLQPPGNDHYVAVNDDASVLGVGVESWDYERGDGEGGPGGIELWDVSTPAEPRRLSTVAPPETSDPTYDGVWTTSHNFDFHGDRLYTSWYQGGVRVFDVADPSSPTELAAFRDDETSFWTACYATNDFFVAPSGEHLSETVPDRLYTFPDPGDEPRAVAGDRRPATDGASGRSRPATATDRSAAGAPGTTSATATNATGTTTGSGPGFGVLGALAGLGLGVGAWRRSGGD